jgi:hypothetical protein
MRLYLSLTSESSLHTVVVLHMMNEKGNHKECSNLLVFESNSVRPLRSNVRARTIGGVEYCLGFLLDAGFSNVLTKKEGA